MTGIALGRASLPAGHPTNPKAAWLLPLGVVCLAYALLGLTLTEPLSHSQIMQRCVLVDPARARLWSVGNVEIGLAYLGVFGGMLFYFLKTYAADRTHLRDLGLALAYLAASFALDYACVQALKPFPALLIGDAVVITFTALVSRQVWFQRLLGVFVSLVFLTCGIGHFLEGLSYWHLTYPVNVPWTMVTADIGFAILLNAGRFPAFMRGEDVIESLTAETARADALEAQIDIRNRAEEGLRASEGLYRALFETMGQGVVYHDADGAITDANPAAERLLGLTLDQMRQRASTDPRWRAVREDGTDLPTDEHPAMVAQRTGRPVQDVVMGIYHPLSDETHWLRVSATPEFRDGEARPSHVYAMFEDITERRAAQLALERISDAFFALDREWRFVYVNAEFERLLSRNREKLLGTSIWDEFPLAVGTESEREYRRAMAEQTVVSFEQFYPPVSAWLEARAFPSPEGLSVYFKDITERKAAEEAKRESNTQILESEMRLRLALESGRLGSWDLDLTAVEFRSVSATFKALYGLEPDDGFTLADHNRAVHPDDLARVLAVIEDARRGRTVGAEFRIRRPDGSERWLNAHGQAVSDAMGRPVHVIGVTQDITEQKAAEEALRAAARRQRTQLKDMLSSVTDGKLRLVETEDELPQLLPEASAEVPIPLTQTEGLRALRQTVKEAAVERGFDDERWQDLMTAASEGGMNAVTHGGGRGEAWVSAAGRDVVQVRVRDWGTGINMENLPRAALSRGWSSTTSLGHGLVMMLQSVDRLWLLTTPGGTVTVLEKDRIEPPPAWL